jgi:pentatricopeptide repeat protein
MASSWTAAAACAAWTWCLPFFPRLLRTGLGINVIIFNYLLKGLCNTKCTEEAMDVLLHKMHKMGCVPNVVSYSRLLKGFCDDRRSQQALDLLQMMAEKGSIQHGYSWFL